VQRRVERPLRRSRHRTRDSTTGRVASATHFSPHVRNRREPPRPRGSPWYVTCTWRAAEVGVTGPRSGRIPAPHHARPVLGPWREWRSAQPCTCVRRCAALVRGRLLVAAMVRRARTEPLNTAGKRSRDGKDDRRLAVDSASSGERVAKLLSTPSPPPSPHTGATCAYNAHRRCAWVGPQASCRAAIGRRVTLAARARTEAAAGRRCAGV
jgi:hypothetical protein